MKILVTGSIAYDRIMDFPQKFSQHILPDKIHILNVSFLIDTLKLHYGGTAGNIAYTLALLKLRPIIFTTVGDDFTQYKNWLIKNRVDTSRLKTIRNEQTAVAHIVTDREDNQITAFFPGALMHECRRPLQREMAKALMAIVSPTNANDMVSHAALYKKNSVPYIFDPGQMITALSKSQLNTAITGAHVVIANDYEMSMIQKKLGVKKEKLRAKTDILVTTLGEVGSIIETKDTHIEVPAVRPKKLVDPTGAGDAYRAGLIYGLTRHFPLAKAGRIGALAATYAVEQHGTQNHTFTKQQFTDRFKIQFKEVL